MRDAWSPLLLEDAPIVGISGLQGLQILPVETLVCLGTIQPSQRLADEHDTVDGSEILHQLIGSSSHYLQGFIHPRWLADFFHQQYVNDVKAHCRMQIN